MSFGRMTVDLVLVLMLTLIRVLLRALAYAPTHPQLLPLSTGVRARQRWLMPM